MSTKSIFLSCFLAVLFITVPGLHASVLKGSGKIVSRTINVSNFTSVSLQSSADLEIIHGAEFSVVLSDYEDLIESHELKVNGHTLKIGVKRFSRLRNSKAKIKITLPGALYSVSVIGSGDVVLGNFNTLEELNVTGSGSITALSDGNYNSLDIKITGSGDIAINGSALDVKVLLAGSGDCDLCRLQSRYANCTISGSGDIKVNATKTLKVTIAGSGDVVYYGNPQLEKHISGSGNISQH